MKLIELAGSPRVMGESFGEQLRSQVHALYEIRLQSALLQARDHGRSNVTEPQLLAIARASFRITEDFDPCTAEEIEGIARGAGLTVEQTMTMNGMTDLRDALSWWEGGELFGGCTSIIAQNDVTREVVEASLGREPRDLHLQIRSQRAADASVRHLDERLLGSLEPGVAGLHQLRVDVDLAHVVHDDRDAQALAIAEDVIEERGLARPQEARENGHWQLGRHRMPRVRGSGR